MVEKSSRYYFQVSYGKKKKEKGNTGGITLVNVKCEPVTSFQHNMTIEDFLNIKMKDSLDHWPLSHSYRLGCTITPFNIT